MPALKWTTVVNGMHKRAVTHFGTTYTVAKDDTGQWYTTVTVPATKGYPGSGGTKSLTDGSGSDFVTYAQAVRAAVDDYQSQGGR
jgi:hypothetical protein